jgi:hypothetical protein
MCELVLFTCGNPHIDILEGGVCHGYHPSLSFVVMSRLIAL